MTSKLATRARARAPADLSWPAAEIQHEPVESLIPYARNSRTHTDDQVAQIAASMREFGWTMPVLIDEEGGIIAGHARVLAARKLGVAVAPCVVARGWSKEKKQAYVIADNKLAENAGWNVAMLKLEVGELASAGYKLELLGFDPDALAALLAPDGTQGLTDPDAAPALPTDPVSRKGDLWLLGRHRILCGDSTVATDVERVLAGVKPHLMVTDPPYGVEYDPSWRAKAGVGSANAAMGKVENDDRADWREAWDLFPGDVCYVWHGGLHAGVVAESLAASRFRLRAQIVWVKTRAVLSRGHYHWQHEPALYAQREDTDDQWRFVPEHELTGYAVRDGATGHWAGDRKQSTVWYIEHLKSETGHGTQKPVECMKRPIENNSSPGQAVYEPFSGSGTTIIACEMTGRSAHAVELSPAYVDVAVERWQAFTGKKATLEGDGRSFDELKAARGVKAPGATPAAAPPAAAKPAKAPAKKPAGKGASRGKA